MNPPSTHRQQADDIFVILPRDRRETREKNAQLRCSAYSRGVSVSLARLLPSGSEDSLLRACRSGLAFGLLPCSKSADVESVEASFSPGFLVCCLLRQLLLLAAVRLCRTAHAGLRATPQRTKQRMFGEFE